MTTGETHDRVEREKRAASRLRAVLIAVGGLAVLFAVFVAVDAVFLSYGVDKYDDDVRYRVSFGQRTGPDGDACWPENDRDKSGRVFCDLVSLGGLHWDTGDVKVAKSAGILMGSGFVCLLDEDGVPWCWEWSQEVQPPRAARVPDDQMFLFLSVPAGHRAIRGERGFVCGQEPDFLGVVCWSVGVDQPEYRQAIHRFVDGHEWVMRYVGDDPSYFSAGKRGAFGDGDFHAFTGEELGPLPKTPGVLVTETLP